MLEFIKVDKKIDEILKIVAYKSIYKFVKDNKTIGYGTINKDEENLIFIFIEEENRGRGYGKSLFIKMLEEAKKQEFQEVKITFKRNNIQMLKIVKSVGGLHLSSKEEEAQYLINIK